MREEWTYRKLGEVCEPKPNIKRASVSFAPNDEILYIDISSIDNRSMTVTMPMTFILNQAPSRAQQVVNKGDILVSLVRPNLRNVAFINRVETNLVASTGFCVIRIPNEIQQRYVFHYIKSDGFTNYLVKLTTGANYPAVREQDVKNATLPVPPISIQQSIVAELDKINELIGLKKSQLNDLDSLAQSIFYEMFGDPVENEKGWEVKRLVDICIKIGSGATPRGGNESYKSQGISLIRSMNVYNNEFRYKDLAFIDEEQGNALSNVVVSSQDILLNITGASVARCCIVPDNLFPARVNQHVCIIRLKSLADSVYLNYMLTNCSYQNRLLSLAKSKAATREALPKSIVDNLFIPLPPLPLQQSFAARITAIEQQKQRISASLKDLETLLASRMQYWFDG